MTDITATNDDAGTDVTILDNIAGLREAFLSQVASIPLAGDDAAARIVGQLLNAGSIDDLDAPWQSNSLREWVGRQLRVTGVKQLPSDFAHSLGVFLVVDAVDVQTGEQIVATTGSISIVAQLARAFTLNAFPLTVIPVESERPSASGYRPMHLQIVR